MRIARLLERRAQVRREGIAGALARAGVEASVEGEAVRISGRGLRARWMRELGLREAGRGL